MGGELKFCQIEQCEVAASSLLSQRIPAHGGSVHRWALDASHFPFGAEFFFPLGQDHHISYLPNSFIPLLPRVICALYKPNWQKQGLTACSSPICDSTMIISLPTGSSGTNWMKLNRYFRQKTINGVQKCDLFMFFRYGNLCFYL